jgi:hypothetical protein
MEVQEHLFPNKSSLERCRTNRPLAEQPTAIDKWTRVLVNRGRMPPTCVQVVL